MKKALIIFNPINKKGYFRNDLDKIVNMLCKCDYMVEIYATKSQKDCTYKIKHSSKYSLIVVSGGDGTLHETINGLVNKSIRPKILYFPSGTINDFAHTLGLQKNTKKMMTIFENDVTTSIDVADCNGTLINYVAAFGPFVSVPYNTPTNLKQNLGSFAYAIHSISEFNNIWNTYHLKVTVDGNEPFEGDYALGMIVNSRSVAGFRNLFSDNDLNDGLFEYLFVPKASIETMLQVPKIMINGMDDSYKKYGFIYSRFKHIKIETEDNFAWTIDGEEGPTGSVEVHVVPKFYEIFADIEKKEH